MHKVWVAEMLHAELLGTHGSCGYNPASTGAACMAPAPRCCVHRPVCTNPAHASPACMGAACPGPMCTDPACTVLACKNFPCTPFGNCPGWEEPSSRLFQHLQPSSLCNPPGPACADGHQHPPWLRKALNLTLYYQNIWEAALEVAAEPGCTWWGGRLVPGAA